MDTNFKMVVDNINGVSRIERVSAATRIFEVASNVYNFTTSTQTNSTNLAPLLRVVAVQFSVSMKQDVAGTATAPFINLFIDEHAIATITPSGANQTDWFQTDIVPVDILTSPLSRFRFEYALAAETGDYGVQASFKVVTIEI